VGEVNQISLAQITESRSTEGFPEVYLVCVGMLLQKSVPVVIGVSYKDVHLVEVVGCVLRVLLDNVGNGGVIYIGIVLGVGVGGDCLLKHLVQ
jgi:hypothetical protein